MIPKEENSRLQPSQQLENEIDQDQSLQTGRHIHREKSYTVFELSKYIWHYGFTVFGFYSDHTQRFRDKFVHQMKSISEDKFNELEQICQQIPGPKYVQMLIALSIYSTNSLWGAFFALFFYTTFNFTFSFIFSLVIDMSAFQYPDYALLGCKIVLVAVFGWIFLEKLRNFGNSGIKVFICFFSAGIFYWQSNFFVVILLYLFSGALLAFGEDEQRIHMQQQSNNSSKKSFKNPLNADIRGINIEQQQNLQLNRQESNKENQQQNQNLEILDKKFQSINFGKIPIQLFIIALFCILFSLLFKFSVYFELFRDFFGISMTYFGGDQILLPLMYSQFSNGRTLVQNYDYFDGFLIMSIFPGPLLNVSVYIAAIFKYGVIRPLACSFCALAGLYLPSFILIMWILPNLQIYMQQKILRNFLRKMAPVSLGIFLSMIAVLFNICWNLRKQESWHYWVILIIFVCLILLKYRFHRLFVFLIGNTIYLVVKYELTKDQIKWKY